MTAQRCHPIAELIDWAFVDCFPRDVLLGTLGGLHDDTWSVMLGDVTNI